MNRIDFPSATVTARRFTYIAFLGIVLCTTPTVMKIVIFGFRNFEDARVLLISLLLSTALLACLFALGTRLLYPPRLSIDGDGLTLRVGTHVDRWPWSQIEAFRIVRASRDYFVALDWKPSPGATVRTRELHYPFRGEPLDLLALLNARQADARRLAPES